MTAKELLASGDRWTDEIARYAMPIVLWCAQNGQKITYGDLEAEMIRRHGLEEVPAQEVKTKYGWPAGKIGDIIFELAKELDEDIPPLNAIIVSKATGLPGKGVAHYLKKFLRKPLRGRLSDENRNALAEETIQAVFDYPNWDKVAQYFNHEELNEPDIEDDDEPIQLPPAKYGQNGVGESEEHKSLKIFLSKNPDTFKEFGKFTKGQTEAVLQSGDKLDVFFKSDKKQLAVEVKAQNAPETELIRGVFQCVKYRATLRATQKVTGEIPNAQVVLATPVSVAAPVKKLAKRLGVPIVNVARARGAKER